MFKKHETKPCIIEAWHFTREQSEDTIPEYFEKHV